VETAEVVVIGAGAAGLACAQALAASRRNAVLLEARDRVGGRISTLRSSSGAVVELGAQVVHPTAELALDDIVRAAGLRTMPLARDGSVVVVEGGRRWEADELARRRAPPPWVVEHWLGGAGTGTIAAALAALPESARTLATAWLDQSIGGDSGSFDVSAVSAAKEARSRGVEQVLVDGFDLVSGSLAAGLDVRLENPALAVRWSDDRVEVDAAELWAARAVVVTVPPSVILAGGLTFDPPLQSAKREAMPRLDSSDAVSIVLSMGEAAPRSSWVLLAEPRGGLWRTTVGSTVVTGHVKGPAATGARARPWDLGDATRVAEMVDPGLGRVVDIHICDWGADPWARGAFSVPVVGADEATRCWAEPVGEVLFFAGEASADPTLRGLVQGAIASGRRAAREVLARLAHG
jgi:monoamine oxidase